MNKIFGEFCKLLGVAIVILCLSVVLIAGKGYIGLENYQYFLWFISGICGFFIFVFGTYIVEDAWVGND